MKRILLFSAFLLISLFVSAQTQHGYVKTKGRLDSNGNLIPGQGLKGATVSVHGRTAVLVNADDGAFSFPVSESQFRLDSVRKKGYQLVDMDALSKTYRYSSNPLYLVMETPEQQLQDQLAAERKIRRTLTNQLHQREDEIEALKAQQKISEEEYREALQKLYEDTDQNEQLVKDMVERYSKIDYDQLNEFDKIISEYILNGELTKADSMLRTKGDINERVSQYKKDEAAIAKEKEKLSRRQAQLNQSEALAIQVRDDLANDCDRKFEIFKMQHLNDSAAYFIELRASLDSNNVEWQLDAGEFLSSYLTEYAKANAYFARSLRCAQNQFSDQSLDMISVYNYLIRFYDRIGHLDEALLYCEKVSQVLETQEDKNNPIIQKSYENMGILYDKFGQRQEAFHSYQTSLEICQSHYGKINHATACSYYNLGAYYYATNEFENAIESIHKSMDILRNLHDTIDECMAADYEILADIYKINGDLEEALDCITKSTEINKALFGESHPNVANDHYILASLFLNKHLFEDALHNFETAMNLYQTALGQYYPDVASCCTSIGIVYNKLGEPEKAISYHNRALDIFQRLFDENSPHIASVYSNIGHVYHEQKDYENAIVYEKKALDIFLANYGENHDKTVICYENLCDSYIGMEEYDKAMQYAQKTLEISKRLYINKNNQSLAYAYNNVSNIYNKMGQYDKSIEYMEQALQILKQIYGEEHHNIAVANYNIGVLYKKMGDLPKSIEYSEKAVKMLVKFLPEDHPNVLLMKKNIDEMKEAVKQ